MDRHNKGDIRAVDCITGHVVQCREGRKYRAVGQADEVEDLPFIGPGLVDLQINGVKRIDFNSEYLKAEDLRHAAGYLLERGVTTFFPTIITNSPGKIAGILSIIDRACSSDPMLARCIGGVHLEGPFISPEEGFRGAHPVEYIREPDWGLFSSFREASGGRIKIVTLSPEWDGSIEFIHKSRDEGILVSIAHSNATGDQLEKAVNAGALLVSHIGNGLPLMLRRHPNILWDQLASDELYASVIADGFHLPESFMKVVLRVKERRAILVSDATRFSGLAPGIYKSHIGSEVVLDREGRLSMMDGKGLLAGSSRILPENLEYLINSQLAALPVAWSMASDYPAALLREAGVRNVPVQDDDQVIFSLSNGRIRVREVFKHGVSVWRS